MTTFRHFRNWALFTSDFSDLIHTHIRTNIVRMTKWLQYPRHHTTSPAQIISAYIPTAIFCSFSEVVISWQMDSETWQSSSCLQLSPSSFLNFCSILPSPASCQLQLSCVFKLAISSTRQNLCSLYSLQIFIAQPLLIFGSFWNYISDSFLLGTLDCL